MAQGLTKTIPLSRLERALAVIAPQAALNRATARMRLGVLPRVMTRYYEAARPSRANYGWLAGFTSGNAEVFGALNTLRARSRELVRNNPQARKAVAALLANSVGTGIIPRAKTGDLKLDKIINDLWAAWIQRCDVEGHYNFYGLQKLRVRAFFESGEALVRYLPQPRAMGLPVPLQLVVHEGDYLDHNKNTPFDDGSRIVQGVQVDKDARRVAYWMFGAHPGDMPYGIEKAFPSRPVPADQIVHLYEKERPGQQRGVPWLYAAMVKLREIDTYEEAELVRKRMEACLAAIVVNPEQISDPASGEAMLTPGITDMQGNQVEAFEPGMTYYARGASDVKFTNPSAVPGYKDYMTSQHHSVAAGALVTYEALTGDLSQVNFASFRAGENQFKRMVGMLQWLEFIPTCEEPIWQRFIDYGVLAGALPAGCPYGVEWSTPRWQSVNPLQDYQATLGMVRAGFQSWEDAVAELGYDAEDQIEAIAAFNTLVDKHGIILDTDPRKVGFRGNLQAAAQTDAQEGNDPAAEEAAQATGESGGAEDEEEAATRILTAALTKMGLNGSSALLARRLVALGRR